MDGESDANQQDEDSHGDAEQTLKYKRWFKYVLDADTSAQSCESKTQKPEELTEHEIYDEIYRNP